MSIHRTEAGTLEVQRPARMVQRERWALALLTVGTTLFMPLALNRFVFPKLTAIAVGVMLATTIPARGRLPRSAIAILTVAAVVLVAAALGGAAPLMQLIGRAPRYEGIVTLSLYLGCCAAGARVLGVGRARGSTRWLLRVLAVGALAVGLEAILEAAGAGILATSVSRPGSLLGNASDEGAWAVLALAPLTAAALHLRDPFYIAGALGASAALVCSDSRGALLGAAAAAAVLVALSPRARARLAVVAGVAALGAAVLALPAARDRVIGTSPLAQATVTGRDLLWRETIRLLDAKPLLGVGPSGYVTAIPAFHDRRYALEVGPLNPPDSPHNWILQAATAGGLPLALLAIVIAGLTVWRGVGATRIQANDAEAAVVIGLLAGLVGYGVALLFGFTSPGTTPLAAVFAGALLAEPLAPRPTTPPFTRPRLLATSWTCLSRLRNASVSPVHRATVSTLGSLALVLAVGGLAEIPLRAAITNAADGHLLVANRDFRVARDLRFWDASVAETASHAYATLAKFGIANAVRFGTPWATTATSDDPGDSSTLADAATLSIAAGNASQARALLSTATSLDPSNPNLAVTAAEDALELQEPQLAVVDLKRAIALQPPNPAAWRALGTAYRAAGNRIAATAATRYAALLASRSDSGRPHQ